MKTIKVDCQFCGIQMTPNQLKTHALTSHLMRAHTLGESVDHYGKEYCAKAVNSFEELKYVLKQCRNKFIEHEKMFDIGDGGMVKNIDSILLQVEGK